MLFTIFFSILASCAQAQGNLGFGNHCSSVFSAAPLAYEKKPVIAANRLSSESPEWRRISVRDAKAPLLDPAYLDRLHASLNKVFVPWFEMKRPFQALPFSEILRVQHTVLVTGESGLEQYQGATLIAHQKTPSHVSAGVYRHEGSRAHEMGHAMTFNTEKKIGQAKSKHLQHMIDWYTSNPSKDKIAEPTSDFPDPFSSQHAAVDLIRLPRLGDEVFIWNEIFSNYITHHYPAPRDVPKLVDAMSRVMSEIRAIPVQLAKSSKLDSYLHLLSEYLYLGIHTHPFEAGNYSLTMSQINYLLTRAQLHGISHGNLDYLGLSEPFEVFKEAFIHSIQESNPRKVRLESISSIRSPSVPLNILIHTADQGDLRFRDGALMEAAGSRSGIEGIYLQPPYLSGNTRIQYKAHIAHLGDTPWLNAGEYLGTWGQGKPIEGISFRIIGESAAKYKISYQARLGSRDWTQARSNGAYCGTRGLAKPITAIVLKVEERP